MIGDQYLEPIAWRPYDGVSFSEFRQSWDYVPNKRGRGWILSRREGSCWHEKTRIATPPCDGAVPRWHNEKWRWALPSPEVAEVVETFRSYDSLLGGFMDMMQDRDQWEEESKLHARCLLDTLTDFDALSERFKKQVAASDVLGRIMEFLREDFRKPGDATPEFQALLDEAEAVLRPITHQPEQTH